MAVVEFGLSEEGIGAFRDALICLNKFSDDVSLDAGRDQLVLTTLNSIKSAYASFTFSSQRFFAQYRFADVGRTRDKFSCTLGIRFLLAIFRSRSVGGGGGELHRERETERHSAIERCDVAIEDGAEAKNRLRAKLVFRNGLTASHQVSFESSFPVHALYDEREADSHWTMGSKTLRELLDHVGRGLDLIDIRMDDTRVTFSSFIEKTVWDEELRKKQLHTSIAVEMDEFEAIHIEAGRHLVLAVKDLRAIVQHASISRASVVTRFSVAGRPMQLTYQSDHAACHFLLMTCGMPGQKTKNTRAAAVPVGSQVHAQPTAPQLTARQSIPAASERADRSQSPVRRAQASAVSDGPAIPPKASPSRFSNFDLRPSQRPPPTIRSEGLFVDDRQWAPVRPDGEEEEDEDNGRLEWEYANTDDSGRAMDAWATEAANGGASPALGGTTGGILTSLAPTQPLADVRRLGLFYDDVEGDSRRTADCGAFDKLA